MEHANVTCESCRLQNGYCNISDDEEIDEEERELQYADEMIRKKKFDIREGKRSSRSLLNNSSSDDDDDAPCIRHYMHHLTRICYSNYITIIHTNNECDECIFKIQQMLEMQNDLHVIGCSLGSIHNYVINYQYTKDCSVFIIDDIISVPLYKSSRKTKARNMLKYMKEGTIFEVTRDSKLFVQLQEQIQEKLQYNELALKKLEQNVLEFFVYYLVEKSTIGGG